MLLIEILRSEISSIIVCMLYNALFLVRARISFSAIISYNRIIILIHFGVSTYNIIMHVCTYSRIFIMALINCRARWRKNRFIRIDKITGKLLATISNNDWPPVRGGERLPQASMYYAYVYTYIVPDDDDEDDYSSNIDNIIHIIYVICSLYYYYYYMLVVGPFWTAWRLINKITECRTQPQMYSYHGVISARLL